MAWRTNCLERAWHIVILINWIQWRLVDLIIFKKHPRALNHFVKNNSSPTVGKERRRYWKKNFADIIKEFSDLFPNLPLNWLPLLKDLNIKRDMIAHWNISLYRDYIFYQPDDNHAKKKLRLIRNTIDGKITKMTCFKLSFDDNNYEDILSSILQFDEKLFPHLAREMGFDYERIR